MPINGSSLRPGPENLISITHSTLAFLGMYEMTASFIGLAGQGR
jgi:hypothetical protein